MGGWLGSSHKQHPAPGPQGPALFRAQRLPSPQLPQLRVLRSEAGGRAFSLPGQHTASARPRRSPGAPHSLQFLCVCGLPHSNSPQGRQDKVGFCQLIPSSHRANVAPFPALQKARPSTFAPRKGTYAYLVPVRLGELLRNRATCVSAHRPPQCPPHPAPHRAGQETLPSVPSGLDGPDPPWPSPISPIHPAPSLPTRAQAPFQPPSAAALRTAR